MPDISVSKLIGDGHDRHWAFVYLHGELEEMDLNNCDASPDIGYFNIDMPDPGLYLGFYRHFPVLIHIAKMDKGHRIGRICLLSDADSVTYVLDPYQWS